MGQFLLLWSLNGLLCIEELVFTDKLDDDGVDNPTNFVFTRLWVLPGNVPRPKCHASRCVSIFGLDVRIVTAER